MKTSILRIILALQVLLLAGCGYGLIGRTSNLPDDIESIYVRPLDNRTTRERVDLLLTEAIVDEMVTRRRFSVVKGPEVADAILQGSLTAYIVRPVQFGVDGRATEYEITIRTDMEFKRQGGDEVLWKQEQYVFRQNYELELDDEGAIFDPEDANVILIARSFAQTLVIDLLEGF